MTPENQPPSQPPQKPQAKRPQPQMPRAVRPGPAPQRPVAPPVAPMPPTRPAGPPRPPVAPRPQVGPRPVATSRPVASTPESGGGATTLIWITLLVGALSFGGYKLLQKDPAPAPAPTPEPVIVQKREEPKPEAPKPEIKAPVEVAKAMPEPEKPAPMPVPETKPQPVVAEVPKLDWTTPLALDGVAGNSQGALKRWGELLRDAAENNKWSAYTGLLLTSMAAELKKSPDFSTPQRYDRYTGNPLFARAMLQYALASRLGEAEKRIAESERVRQVALWIMESNEVMESLLRALTDKDKLSSVLDAYSLLAADDRDALGAYRELAVACAVVFEKPKQFGWNGQDITVTAQERYQWYKEKDKAGLLATKLTKLTAWQLSWVVSVQVPKEEMEWAIAELRRKLKQSNWGQAYGMIQYDMQKAVTGKMKNPYDYYTFSEILKKGGICGDQSYFAANTARCVGIPATGVSGDGPRGPHAWMTWLSDDDKWSFSGRFAGYPSGRVRDPRNNQEFSEQYFTRLSDNRAPSTAMALRAQRFVWLSEVHQALKQGPAAENAIELALQTTPNDADLWLRKIALWRTRLPAAAPGDWKTFLNAFQRRFDGDTDLQKIARDAEDEFVLSKMDATTAKNELRHDTRALGKSKKGLTSLEEILTTYKREGEVLWKAKDWESLRRLYREALDDYGREPAKFKGIAKDYWYFVQTEEAPRVNAARDIENAFERHVETKSGDFFDVTSQVSAGKIVAEYWRAAGDVKRAERFEKEMEKRKEKATKNAL